MNADAPIEVRAMSPEEAEHGTAELWCAGRLLGFTRLEEGEIVVHLPSHPTGRPLVLGALALQRALADVTRLLAGY